MASGKTSRIIARDRSGTTTSGYREEYPPSNLSQYISSPMRRASSESRLEVLYKKENVRELGGIAFPQPYNHRSTSKSQLSQNPNMAESDVPHEEYLNVSLMPGASSLHL